jgi:hypothetical protein
MQGGRIVKSFKDHDNKKGKVGDKVVSIHEDKPEIKTVREIISKGIAGTRIYFEGEEKSELALFYRIAKD